MDDQAIHHCHHWHSLHPIPPPPGSVSVTLSWTLSLKLLKKTTPFM